MFVREHWLCQGNVREIISRILWEPCNQVTRVKDGPWSKLIAQFGQQIIIANRDEKRQDKSQVRQLQPLWGTMVDFHVYMFKPVITSTYYILANG